VKIDVNSVGHIRNFNKQLLLIKKFEEMKA